MVLLQQIYDLKGSTRNRHVQSTGRENEVLLDENLVESKSRFFSLQRVSLIPCKAAHFSPFYLQESSKRIFRGALYNDSKFLSDINVMDYSLVVGVDNETHELVAGIVGRFIPLAGLSSYFYRLMRAYRFTRLYSHVHMGQEA